jgi:hypothetical protein
VLRHQSLVKGNELIKKDLTPTPPPPQLITPNNSTISQSTLIEVNSCIFSPPTLQLILSSTRLEFCIDFMLENTSVLNRIINTPSHLLLLKIHNFVKQVSIYSPSICFTSICYFKCTKGLRLIYLVGCSSIFLTIYMCLATLVFAKDSTCSLATSRRSSSPMDFFFFGLHSRLD